jgi:hypothetical protein
MTDLDLIKNIKDNRDSESLKCLISRHSGIFCEMVKRYQYFISQKGHDPKDLYEDKDVIVYQSALSFNEDKNCKISDNELHHVLNTFLIEYDNSINSTTLRMPNELFNIKNH